VLTLFPALKQRIAQRGGPCRAANSRSGESRARLMARPRLLLLDERRSASRH